MLTATLPRLPARPGARWMPSFPALVEGVLVVAAIAVLWPFFEQVAQLGGAGRDQRFLDHGIAVIGLPDAIVPAACDSVGALAEARVAMALCGSRKRAAAQPPIHLPSTVAQAIARTSEAFQRPLRDAEQRALAPARAGRKRRRRAARAGRCDRGDRIGHRAVPAALPDRERRRRRSAAAALRGTLGRWRARGPASRRRGGRDRHHGARQRRPPPRRRARRPRRHGTAGRRGAAPPRAAAHRDVPRRGRVARRDRVADGRRAPVARQLAQERSDARSRRLGRMAMGGGDGARLRLPALEPAHARARARRRRGARRLGRCRLAGTRAVAARRQPRAGLRPRRRRLEQRAGHLRPRPRRRGGGAGDLRARTPIGDAHGPRRSRSR